VSRALGGIVFLVLVLLTGALFAARSETCLLKRRERSAIQAYCAELCAAGKLADCSCVHGTVRDAPQTLRRSAEWAACSASDGVLDRLGAPLRD
jgi:hypothetical protein